MDAPKGEWRKARLPFVSGEEYWIGLICVGSYRYDPIMRDDAKPYSVRIDLPSITMKTGTRQPTVVDARNRLERAVIMWFKWLNETKE